jgi:hypothetical protein
MKVLSFSANCALRHAMLAPEVACCRNHAFASPAAVPVFLSLGVQHCDDVGMPLAVAIARSAPIGTVPSGHGLSADTCTAQIAATIITRASEILTSIPYVRPVAVNLFSSVISFMRYEAPFVRNVPS